MPNKISIPSRTLLLKALINCWAALPADEGPDQEKLHSEHLSALLGYMPDIRYHDLVILKHDTIDNLLATRILSFEDIDRT